MDTLEAIFSRRSIRDFTSEQISDDELNTLIQAAAAAPSGSNAQKRIFVAVRDPRRIAALRALSPGIIGLPAAVIVICLDQRDGPRGGTAAPDPALLISLGTALQNLLLAAHAAGLGACPVVSFHQKGLGIFLALPEGITPSLLVVLGRPHSIPSAPARKPLHDIFFQESYEVSGEKA